MYTVSLQLKVDFHHCNRISKKYGMYMRNPHLSGCPVGPVLYDAVPLPEIDEAPEHEVSRRRVDEQSRSGLQWDSFVLS